MSEIKFKIPLSVYNPVYRPLLDCKKRYLVFYGGSDNGRYLGIYHVAIYVGNGKAVEALNTEYGVVYQTLRTNNAIMVCRPNK